MTQRINNLNFEQNIGRKQIANHEEIIMVMMMMMIIIMIIIIKIIIIRSKTAMIRLGLCDYSDPYIFVTVSDSSKQGSCRCSSKWY